MLSKGFEKYLLEKERTSDYNFEALIVLLGTTSYEFKAWRLNGPYGLTTPDEVLIDTDMLEYKGDDYAFFTILHELCHAKRVERMGRAKMFEHLRADSADEYFEHVCEEEILADRYARYGFFKLNQVTFPYDETQMLELDVEKVKYHSLTNQFFDVVGRDENKWQEVVDNIKIYEIQ